MIINDYFSPEMVSVNPDSITLHEQTSDTKSPSSLYALSSCLMDTASGRVLYSKDADKQLPMASTTKIMTCILALESGKINDIVSVSKYAQTMPDVQLNICEGEQYYMKDLLYSLMLESHNDTAVAIAEHIGGSVEGFATLMNNKATELGLTNTHFVTPNGLDADGHYTTARELCSIASYAIKNADFLTIINTPSHSFKSIDGKRSFTVNNRDAFLSMYDGAIGIKTGFTGKAGYCFVGAATRNDTTLVSSVLASGWPPNKSYKWHDTKTLMNYGFDYYTSTSLLNGNYSSASIQNGITLYPLRVQDSNNHSGSITKTVDIAFSADCKLPVTESDNIYLKLTLPEYLSPPIKEGTVVGNASLIVNDNVMYQYPIYSVTTADKIDLEDTGKLILRMFMPFN